MKHNQNIGAVIGWFITLYNQKKNYPNNYPTFAAFNKNT